MMPYYYKDEDKTGFYQDIIRETNAYEPYKEQYLTEYTKNEGTGHQYLRVVMMEKMHLNHEKFMAQKSLTCYKYNDQKLKYEEQDRFLLSMTNGDRDFDYAMTQDEYLVSNNHTFYFERELSIHTRALRHRFQVWKHTMRQEAEFHCFEGNFDKQ